MTIEELEAAKATAKTTDSPLELETEEETEEESCLEEDLGEALELLESCLTHLESIAMARRVTFMQIKEVMELGQEVRVFLEQWGEVSAYK